jgi:hypothetical protein
MTAKIRNKGELAATIFGFEVNGRPAENPFLTEIPSGETLTLTQEIKFPLVAPQIHSFPSTVTFSLGEQTTTTTYTAPKRERGEWANTPGALSLRLVDFETASTLRIEQEYTKQDRQVEAPEGKIFVIPEVDLRAGSGDVQPPSSDEFACLAHGDYLNSGSVAGDKYMTGQVRIKGPVSGETLPTDELRSGETKSGLIPLETEEPTSIRDLRIQYESSGMYGEEVPAGYRVRFNPFS